MGIYVTFTQSQVLVEKVKFVVKGSQATLFRI